MTYTFNHRYVHIPLLLHCNNEAIFKDIDKIKFVTKIIGFVILKLPWHYVYRYVDVFEIWSVLEGIWDTLQDMGYWVPRPFSASLKDLYITYFVNHERAHISELIWQ